MFYQITCSPFCSSFLCPGGSFLFFFPWVLSAPRRQEYPLRERDPTRDVGPSGGSIGGMVYKNFCDQEREKHIKTKHSLAADHQEPWNEVATRRMKMPVFRSVCLCRTWYPCVSQPSRASDHVCCCCCCSPQRHSIAQIFSMRQCTRWVLFDRSRSRSKQRSLFLRVG